MGPGNEMVMTKFVLEYHSHMNEEENMGRALHKPVIALLTDFLKVTLVRYNDLKFTKCQNANYTKAKIPNISHV